MKDASGNDGYEEDVDFESEEELGDAAAAREKLKKLRQELAESKKERQEYLDGWQRCKADMVNAKREAAAFSERTGRLLRDTLVTRILPALDSFDAALGSEAWTSVDQAWRGGMESTHAQLLAALEQENIVPFGLEGERFDPALHEAVQEMQGTGESHTIAKIFRRGWKSGETVLRPAQVALWA